MRNVLFLVTLLLPTSWVLSQDMTKFKLYTPGDNAEQMISEAVKKAKREGKHVFIQIGGNWCIWCARFNALVTTDRKIDSIMKSDYVFYPIITPKKIQIQNYLQNIVIRNASVFPFFLCWMEMATFCIPKQLPIWEIAVTAMTRKKYTRYSETGGPPCLIRIATKIN